jgi:hypothetical protein
MTLPSGNCRSADRRRWRWSQTGNGGGCTLPPPLPQIEHHSPDNRTCRRDPQPRPHPIASPAWSARRSSPQSSGQLVTPKSP